MVDAKRLREQSFSRENVVSIWSKAVESARDAEIAALSMDGALQAAYNAGHMAALALLASHGLKPSGGQGHHEAAFAGELITTDPALAHLVIRYPPNT